MRLRPGEFLGQPLRSLMVAGFTLTQYEYAPHSDLPLHEHEYAYLSFPLSGAYDEFCGPQQRTCLPGAAVFHPRGEAHRDQFHGRGATIFSVEFDDFWLDRLRDDAVQCETRYDVNAAAVVRAKTLMAMVSSGSSLRIQAAAIQLLAELPATNHSKAVPRWMRRVRECLHQSVLRPSLDSLAAVAGVHAVHLARTFREVHGCTVGEYYRSLRIDRAIALLQQGQRSLGAIASECGFSDQSHLSREIKRATGASPAKFAKRVQ